MADGPLWLASHRQARVVSQAQHDYLQGNYPVVREDAAQMCALQMQAEAGPTLLDQSDGLEPYLEKFIVRQVCAATCIDQNRLPWLFTSLLATYCCCYLSQQHRVSLLI